jgi:hypothetical protein
LGCAAFQLRIPSRHRTLLDIGLALRRMDAYRKYA